MNKKISLIVILIMICTIIFPYVTSATEIAVTNEIVKVADDLGLGDLNQYKGTGEDAPLFLEKVNTIVSVIETVGVISSVIILIVIGIKYMMGSAEEKAEYKKTMIPYIVGAILIFAAATIANAIYNFVSKI